MDPTLAEESRREASVLLAMMPAANEVTQLEMQGEGEAVRSEWRSCWLKVKRLLRGC